ncbi:hypothetical protein SDC9_160910 [bioreactor metagenome]|uniref:Uncharacterized protein n=1 Tax=bioreactor metagenome TaxID=1076179 RepID=A0A645FGR5_9ZZZZ
MGKMTGKIIGTQLVVRIQPFFHQVIGPGSKYLPMFCRIIGVSFHLGNSGGQDKHIPRFLHRHISPISLSVGKRIRPHIMCRKGFRPFSTFTVIEYMIQ